ncbi:DUF3318 domain-containing protein [Burkholderia glumae]|uniref:DUF3318 domain-containing protein n=1 Tax=Burkholderia glumae TaxID=337 RepID=A0AAP9Y6K5_BURGL|nr:DUF3318 domain-containing protein [Burkholderia glumae]ACR27878.1 Hypothetical protein bglu_1g06850 [Burkholderia glumae BGR1]AJY66808.1 hypothetical protein KS03_1614 [Burkholderia glumae LMG 2196 = ATCC 33617]KHJ61268.1 hypothetical protein NCPPB3923_19675 [Burkholderia glumae]MCM2481144.1 DUF3318 domain-containing protein [Burkholderia glumae]MCM2492177.1 DUF3318 domain-containing protein [Burkholderia glumae]
MNQSAPDEPFRPPRSRRRLNATQYRALRKELLILRSDVERLELAQAGSELRQAVTHFRWLKLLIPGFSGRGAFGKSGKGLNASLGALVGQYPLLSSLASVVLAKPVRTLVVKSAGPAIKWGSIGFAVWEAYQIWRGAQRDKTAAEARQAGSTPAAAGARRNDGRS